ncbi:hypothetical protein ACFOHY_10240 [Rhizobium rosettiformans]
MADTIRFTGDDRAIIQPVLHRSPFPNISQLPPCMARASRGSGLYL